MTISVHLEVTIAIFTNHHHLIIARHQTALRQTVKIHIVNHLTVEQQAVIRRKQNRLQNIRIVEILAAVQQNITIMIHMMMDMMTFIWTETTIQTGTIQMTIMQKA